MAPESSASPPARRKPREGQYLFNVGVQGRKTGITLPEGERDENGLETMNGLFSSPERPKSVRSHTGGLKSGNRRMASVNATISSEDDMDTGEGTIPEPKEVLGRMAYVRIPPPKSTSPKKTNLRSPARRNPSFVPSSPVRELAIASSSSIAPVRRRLSFSAGEEDGSLDQSMQIQKAKLGKLTNGARLAPARPLPNGHYKEDAPLEPFPVDHSTLNHFQEEDEELEEAAIPAEPEFQPEPPKRAGRPKGKGKDKASEPSKSESLGVPVPAPKKRGRPPKHVKTQPIEEQHTKGVETDEVEEAEVEEMEAEEEQAPPAKRTRRSLETATVVTQPARQARPKPMVEEPSKANISADAASFVSTIASANDAGLAATSTLKAKATSKPRSKSVRSNLPSISEGKSPVLQRGPPMPRGNRGLFILRRETPTEGAGSKRTRSGRNSIRPLAYWKNERIEYDEKEIRPDLNGAKIMLPSIKEVVRADAVDLPSRPRPKKLTKVKKRTRELESEDEHEDIDAEPWESEPGRIFGNIRSWDEEEVGGSDSVEHEEEIALSSGAIITREIKGASFKFAKTLTLPFFGSGMVDLPSGAVKKTKNSRKMQMVFFVFCGRVRVTVNEKTFSIGKGGMWQVPRGNFYSIANENSKPARIFFAQGCELEAPEEAAKS